MIKTLTKHGNSAALVIERPILELLNATLETPFEITTDGESLLLTPVRDEAHQKKFREAMGKIGKRYAKSFRELAK
jgi:antitoxin component of MazEF toxin-antitoxin module